MKFRFSIRDLLWLTLVVGMAVAWWIDHRRNDRRYQVLEFRDSEALVTDRDGSGGYIIWSVYRMTGIGPDLAERWLAGGSAQENFPVIRQQNSK